MLERRRLRALQLSRWGVAFLGGPFGPPYFLRALRGCRLRALRGCRLFARPATKPFGVSPFSGGLAALPAFPSAESRFIAVTPTSFEVTTLLIAVAGYAWAV